MYDYRFDHGIDCLSRYTPSIRNPVFPKDVHNNPSKKCFCVAVSTNSIVRQLHRNYRTTFYIRHVSSGMRDVLLTKTDLSQCSPRAV